MMKKKVCAVCFQNCVRLHGSEDENDEEEISPVCSWGGIRDNAKENAGRSYPSFLKKMTELNMTSVLQMPASFVKNSITRIGETITLEGPSKGKWSIEVGGTTSQNSSMEFRGGWTKFVSDHILQIGDQLSFTLTADSHFQVVVYDESGSQKVSAIDAMNSPAPLKQLTEKEAAHMNGTATEQFRSNGTTPKQPKGKGALGTSDQMNRISNGPVARPKQKVRRKARTDSSMPSVKPVVLVIHSSESELRNSDPPKREEEEEELKELASEAQGQTSSEQPPDIDGRHLPLLPPHKLINGNVSSQRRLITEAEKERVLKAAQALPLTNPKLVVVMSKAYVYKGFWMSLSRPFAKAHMPHESREVTLLNKAGHKWPVKWLFKEHENGRASSGFSGGWRGFALDHRLEESDVCVFEVVDSKNAVILVHIFRALGEPREDVGDYRPSPVKARNVDGKKRKTASESTCHHAAGQNLSPITTKAGKTPGDFKSSPGETHKASNGKALSCSKRLPADIGHGMSKADFVLDGAMQYDSNHNVVKKAKTSPDADNGSYVTPPIIDLENGSVGGADLQIRPSHSKKSESSRGDLVKLGKELVGQQSVKSSSHASHSDGNEETKALILATPIQEKEDLNMVEISEPPPFQTSHVSENV